MRLPGRRRAGTRLHEDGFYCAVLDVGLPAGFYVLLLAGLPATHWPHGAPTGWEGGFSGLQRAICCILGVSSPYRPRKRFHACLSHTRLSAQAARLTPGLRVIETSAEPGRSLAGGGESPTCGGITPAHRQSIILSYKSAAFHA